MACREEVHVDDVGTVFRSTVLDTVDPRVVADLSGVTTQEFIFKKPDETTITRTTSFTTDGTDGLIEYATIAGDLDQIGAWKIQAHLVNPSGDWHTTIHSFSVFGNL